MTATNHNGVYITGQQKPNAKHHKLSAAQISEAKKRVAEYKACVKTQEIKRRPI